MEAWVSNLNGLAALAPGVEYHFWALPPGSAALWLAIIGTFIAGLLLVFGLMQAPPNLRRPIVWSFTFGAGLFYVIYYFWPKPIARETASPPDVLVEDVPIGFVDAVAFWFTDALPVVSNITQVIGGLMLGLGIYSLVTVHSKRLLRKHKDAFFSATLLISIVLMVAFGFWDYYVREKGPNAGEQLPDMSNWALPEYGFNFLFDGLLQQMDAAMFSMIAFFILSAAYRAFRIRSVESTVMMASALIFVLSLMGLADYLFSMPIRAAQEGGGNEFLNNFTLPTVAAWIKDYMQVPSLRALEFGIGLGALAMGLRIWLGLEKGVGAS
jgi:hypothetical protein